ncbi:uncharacterized protein LOC144544246 isoform X2 [Carex rostrata]
MQEIGDLGSGTGGFVGEGAAERCAALGLRQYRSKDNQLLYYSLGKFEKLQKVVLTQIYLSGLLSGGDMTTTSTCSSSWFIVGKASISLSSVLISRLITLMFFFPFLHNDMVANISRQIVEITPVMRKSPEKLTKDSVFNSSVRLAVSLALLRRFESPIHFFSIWIMSSPSVMLRIALDMSATSGEPLVKACPSIIYREGCGTSYRYIGHRGRFGNKVWRCGFRWLD